MDEAFIHDYVCKTLNEYHLKEASLKNISAYVKFCLISNHEGNPVHFGFMVQTDKYIKGSFIHDFLKILRNVVSSSFTGLVVSERELLDKHPDIFNKLKSNSVLFIQECEDSPMTESEENTWKTIADLFREHSHVVPVMMASDTIIENRFKGHDDLFYRIFRYKIYSKNTLNISEVEKETTEILLSHDLTMDKAFEQEIHDYIETVYDKADLKGFDFVSDLIDRIIGQYYRKDQMDGILDSSCVPFYKKSVSFVPAANSPSQETSLPEDDPGTVDIKDYVPKSLDDSTDIEVKNVLLLALSTFPYNSQMKEFTYEGTYAGTNYSGSYFYQMEPVVDLLTKHLSKKGEHIDEIIILSTKETEETVENIRVVTKDNKTNTVIMSDREEPTRISPLDYFVYCVNKRNSERSTKFSIHDCSSLETSHIAETIHEVLTKLREHSKAKVYVDIHGGPRTTQQLVSSILSLLHLEGIGILSDNVFNVRIDKNNTSYVENAGNTFRIMDFVSGMNEFMAYGRTDSLERFYKNEKKLSHTNEDNIENTKSELEAIEIFKKIASGIQLCDITSFENGLKNLRTFNSSMSKTSSFLSIFWNDVETNYKGLLNPGESKASVLDEIRWCISKGFYQQALTLIESRMPEELINDKKIINIQNNSGYNPSLRTPVSDFDLKRFKCKIINSNKPDLELERILNNNKLPWGTIVNCLFERWATSCYVINTKLNKETGRNEKIYLDLKSSFDLLQRQMRNNINNPQNMKIYINSLDTSLCGSNPNNYLYFETKEDPSHKDSVKLRISPVRRDIKPQLEKFMCLHMTLKNQRNSSNHASDDSYTLEVIEWALRAYVTLAEECFYK
ncbi:TM1812 family CRISPR-associated protein [Oribacterium sp. FC2011]|uniref:TM1812 family CRISPR-associated protein n=1 Tax=Oribacterium sp. FC2011 TaxID=1408311 RepID=UPI0004E27DAC|nr:TM1812 family CRISPR-associated protein [Oribacterium sp. FC2011]